MLFYVFTCVGILLMCGHPSFCVLEWLFGDRTEEELTGVLVPKRGSGGAHTLTRFEVLSADEQFLDLARNLNDMSALDACYNVVIFLLKKKCSELNEEEFGKLSVRLLNCQLEAENRQVFPCTDPMTLPECTEPMDAITWNSYQIVSNRARAMCYATQQNQFRKLTEATVNKLASVASEQVKSLNDLKTGQEQLHTLTSETVRKLYESQQTLMSTQLSLQEAHQDVFKHIAANVKEIMQEKALIASGNQELAAMTDNIRRKLDLTADQIQERERVEHLKHESILKDLKNIQDSSSAAVQTLESSLHRVLGKFEELERQYSGMSSSLSKINVTMNVLMASVETLSRTMNERITWISQLLDGTGDKLSAVTCCLLHIAYFFMVAVTATFLQLSIPARLGLLVVIVGNVAAELNYNHSFDFAGLTVFLLSLLIGFKLIKVLNCKFGVINRLPGTTSLNRYLNIHADSLSAQEVQKLLALLLKFYNSVQEYQNQRPVANGRVVHETRTRVSLSSQRSDRSSSSPEPLNQNRSNFLQNHPITRQALVDQVRGQSPGPLSHLNTSVLRRSRSTTPLSDRCHANTVTGVQCRLPVVAGSEFCRIHADR